MEHILKNKHYIVLDDFISTTLQNEIYDTLDNKFCEFDWYYYDKTVSEKSLYHKRYNDLLKNVVDTGQFVHTFLLKTNGEVSTSPHLHLVYKIVNEVFMKYNIKGGEIIRAKANFLLNSRNANKNTHSQPHRDQDGSHTVFLYYVNDSDGDTFLFNDDGTIRDKITPKKGRLLIFNGEILHASSNPVNNHKRWVINIDMESEYEY